MPEQTTTPTIAEDLVFTVREVSERLKISEWMVNKLIREHELSSVQIGMRRLVPAADLASYLNKLRANERRARHGW